VTYFKVLSQRWPEGTEDAHAGPQSGLLATEHRNVHQSKHHFGTARSHPSDFLLNQVQRGLKVTRISFRLNLSLKVDYSINGYKVARSASLNTENPPL
jgi:hypothetical protein